MKKISIYVSNQELKPSNYYRIVQYAKRISGVTIYNIYPTFIFRLMIRYRSTRIRRRIFEKILRIVSNYRIKKYLKKDLNSLPDIVVVQKSMSKFSSTNQIRKLREKLISNTKFLWDFDDIIFQSKQIQDDEYYLYCKYAKNIIVTSNYLKNDLPSECHNKIKILPTTDFDMHISFSKLKDFNRNRLEKMKSEIDLIWLATSSNLDYLVSVLPYLEKTAKILKIRYHKQLTLKIVCDKGLDTGCYYLNVRFIKWSREVAIEEVRSASIGIMPLIPSFFSKGKGGFKLIQYISSGLPVIASNVGYNEFVFKDDIGFLLDQYDDWIDAIIELSINRKKWENCSTKALQVWEKYFNAEDNLKFWEKML